MIKTLQTLLSFLYGGEKQPSRQITPTETDDANGFEFGFSNIRISEKVSAEEVTRLTRKTLENEKAELQAGLEKELEGRSSKWSSKLKEHHSEELRLRERVRQLAEENVSLQREVSTFRELKKTESMLIELTGKVEKITEENRILRGSIGELQEKNQDSLADLECIMKNYEEKERECRDLEKSLTRLFRACDEQENTIKRLQDGLCMEIEKKQPVEESDKLVQKLQMEQMRFTGLELALIKELESSKVEANSLRQENIHLLNSLKGDSNRIDVLTFKLDTEMRTCISCLQDPGLSMLYESNQLSSKLLEFVKWKEDTFSQAHGVESNMNGFDSQFIIESDTRLQGINQRAENLTRSLQIVSTLLHEKCNLVTTESESGSIGHQGSEKLNDQLTKEAIRTELKVETLLTTLLREKLYSKELEVQQLEAELATAVQGSNILRFEIENALDNLSCATHRSTEIELQMLKKDERVDHLQSDLQEITKELIALKDILPKVTEERDMMWEKVKEYGENIMLLNLENDELKKKIELLDDDLLLKEGEISILKDSTGSSTPVDLLTQWDSVKNFW